MSEEKPCPFCQEACEPGAFLQRHISFKHFNAAVKCEHCEKTFNQQTKPYTGSRKFGVVGRWYHSEEDFQSHQEKDHSSSPSVPKEQPASSHGPFCCCDEDRGSEANLKIHKKYTHDSEKDGVVSEKSIETLPSSNGIAKITSTMVLSIVGATIAGPLLVTGGLAVAGFGAAGVGAGTLAAGIQSGIGNVVAGSMFATAQSIGAAGLASGTTAAIAGGSGTLAGFGHYLYQKSFS